VFSRSKKFRVFVLFLLLLSFAPFPFFCRKHKTKKKKKMNLKLLLQTAIVIIILLAVSPSVQQDVIWPQLSDTVTVDSSTNTVYINNLVQSGGPQFASFTISNLFNSKSNNANLVFRNCVFDCRVYFERGFQLRNQKIIFENSKILLYPENPYENLYKIGLFNSSIEIYNCTIEPPMQATEFNSTTYRNFTAGLEYIRGIQITVDSLVSKNWSFVMKRSKYRFVHKEVDFISFAPPFAVHLAITLADNVTTQYNFYSVEICDNFFETNHGWMTFFKMECDEDEIDAYFNWGFDPIFNGTLYNVSGNRVNVTQREHFDLTLVDRDAWRSSRYSLLGPSLKKSLVVKRMHMDSNDINIDGILAITGYGWYQIFRAGFYRSFRVNGKWDALHQYLGNIPLLTLNNNKVLFKVVPLDTIPNYGWGPQLAGASFAELDEIRFVDRLECNNNQVAFF
jgi:hypothetical protein